MVKCICMGMGIAMETWRGRWLNLLVVGLGAATEGRKKRYLFTAASLHGGMVDRLALFREPTCKGGGCYVQ